MTYALAAEAGLWREERGRGKILDTPDTLKARTVKLAQREENCGYCHGQRRRATTDHAAMATPTLG
jgi:hypothetical protein